MRTRIMMIAAGTALALTLGACGSGSSTGSAGSGTTGPSSGTGTTRGTSTGPGPTATQGTGGASDAALVTALTQASTLERTALATYQGVITALGPITPFTNVVTSEQQHVNAVNQIATAHGVTLPTAAVTPAPAPSTKTAACQLGVTTEENVISRYQVLIPQVSAYPDVAKVFTTLQTAAKDSHLPAFQHCA